MIIFLNDDRAYLAWVTHHRPGFVLDGKRKPRIGHLVLHRATCSDIKAAPGRKTHWTTAGRLKACCLTREELEQWAAEETEQSPALCPICQPLNELPQPQHDVAHLSKLTAEILEYVLEAALIHLEVEQPPYRLTVGDIAACFGKTPAQISTSIHRLIDEEFVTVTGKPSSNVPLPPKWLVLPTATALRTIEDFKNQSDEAILAELAKLQST